MLLLLVALLKLRSHMGIKVVLMLMLLLALVVEGSLVLLHAVEVRVLLHHPELLLAAISIPSSTHSVGMKSTEALKHGS